MDTLIVSLGARAYPIHIGAGILGNPSLLQPHVTRGQCAAVITDSSVAPLYLARVADSLSRLGARVVDVIVPPGEASKRWELLDGVIDSLIKNRVDRNAVVLALGGGVVGDLAGFAAAIYQRGVPFIQIPTTLLAQVDSSVGGKTAINHARGKNMIGVFHQPQAVIADVATLDTLPEREMRAGIAEVIKHGFILDPDFVAWLEANLDKVLEHDVTALTRAIRRSCELKAQVVARDERETGERAILNFGHTFAHAIETGTGYGKWLHGEAVGVGMVMAAELSASAGMLPRPDAARVRALVGRAGLPTAAPQLDVNRYLELMAVDKKVSGSQIRFVLLEAMGRATLRGDLDGQLVRDVIASNLEPSGRR